MFRGINAINLDSKGRFAIPSRYREGLGEQIVATIDTEEPCLLLYPVLQWQTIEDGLQKLPSFNAAARRIQRLLIGHATTAFKGLCNAWKAYGFDWARK